ncbi:hypothetical protein [Methylobacter sp. S3L5C]|uniref:hypothetical protein n=1 Tax=Methylobacter sp. S3L5C TaxID=2839024 RepID=UPI001FAD0EFC|nr:hypothetical protein [Methylobacter sp. S3L5C]UOA09122.1 hypothetical protein KKZ03_02025 [Methylobacter sp. S3L5C]
MKNPSIITFILLTSVITLSTMASAATSPTVSIVATPTTITYGTTATIKWSSTNATSCTASSGWSGTKTTSGTFVTPILNQAVTYKISCTGKGGTKATATTVWVQASTSTPPTLTLTATPVSIANNTTSTLVWASTNATSCVASNGWYGNQLTSGALTVTALPNTTTYTLACKGPGGTTSKSAVVVAATLPLPLPLPVLPIITLSASQASIANGATSVLTWSSTNATSCLASGGWTGTEPTSGTFITPALTTTTSYSLACAGLGGSAIQSTTITVAPSSGGNGLLSSGSAGSKMGINISWINDWGNRDLTFVDIMKQARGFATVSAPWDPTNNPAPLDAKGWPTTDFGVYFITNPSDPLSRPLTTTFPSMFGTYKLSFTGKATVNAYNCCKIQNATYSATNNTTTADVVVGPTDELVALTFTNTTNGAQNIQLLRPGYPIGTTQIFTSEFLKALSPFSTIRVMEALLTNGNPGSTWAARKLSTDPTQQDSRGIAWEYVIQLANASGKDIWINIPDKVDLNDTTANNYVTQLATLIKNTLKPGIHVYVEYSNELWNSSYGFSQTADNTAAAVAEVKSGADATLNYDNGNNQWYWGYRRAAHQTVKISQLFANVFGPSAINTTIRPVYMSQYVQPFITQDALLYLNANFGAPNKYLYAIGGAPYFSTPSSYIDINSLFTSLLAGINEIMPGFSDLPAYNGGIVYSGIQFKSLANYYGLKSIMYEGGPDLSINSSAAFAETAAGDHRINQMVQAQLANFLGCGNDLFVYYKLAGPAGDMFGAYEDVTVPSEKSKALNTVAATPLTSYTTCLPTMTNQLYIQ